MAILYCFGNKIWKEDNWNKIFCMIISEILLESKMKIKIKYSLARNYKRIEIKILLLDIKNKIW